MWLSMINADVEGMKRYAEAMNVGNLFGLFACMLTARSWKALEKGISKHEFTETEVSHIVVYFLKSTHFLKGNKTFCIFLINKLLSAKSKFSAVI